jgi:hypothetical protein
MGSREQECWDRFCKSGLVSDYLEYRSAVDFERRAPEEETSPEGEEGSHAGWNQGSGAQSQKPGGI